MAATVKLCQGAMMSALVVIAPLTAEPLEVDLELVLAVDVSSSMDEREQEVQREGYLLAFTDPFFLRAVALGSFARIAVTYVEWAGVDEHDVLVPWTLLANRADASAITDVLQASPQIRRSGGTSISGALVFAADLFENNGFTGRRQVIDLSGDGFNNIGPPVLSARDHVLARNITINGLVITLDGAAGSRAPLTSLDDYFDHCVIGGAGAFVISASSVLELAEVIRHKLILDIAGLPAGVDDLLHRTVAPSVDCMVGEAQARGMHGRP